jgi:hypothetical protein
MITVAAGDSFVRGDELGDCASTQHSLSTWPALLAPDEYVCVARAGVGNEFIARQVMTYCELKQKQDIFVVVQWTFPNRYEFRFTFDTGQRDVWYTVGAWHLIDDIADIEREFHNEHFDTLNTQRDHLERAKKTGVRAFADRYFRDVGSSEYWEIYNSLKEIVNLQNYLKLNQIPYMFACADNVILHNFTISNPDATIQALLAQLDTTHWAWFPAGTHEGETQTPRGFYQWAVENKYPIGATHPLEEAHQAAAEILKDKFNELAKKAV